MKWRIKRAGSAYHRYDMWYARKDGVVYNVNPAKPGWYVSAHGNDIRKVANSLWDGYGNKRFNTAEEAMTWAEAWTPDWSIR